MHTSVVGFRKERTDRRSTLLLGAMGTYRGKQFSIITPLLGYGERQTIFLQNVKDNLLHTDTSNIYIYTHIHIYIHIYTYTHIYDFSVCVCVCGVKTWIIDSYGQG